MAKKWLFGIFIAAVFVIGIGYGVINVMLADENRAEVYQSRATVGIDVYNTKNDLEFLKSLLLDIENIDQKKAIEMSVTPFKLAEDLRRDIAELEEKNSKKP
ncbi:MAG: hypothetical protein WAV73_03855 [Candidatus Moraniibacteriota bacterium]